MEGNLAKKIPPSWPFGDWLDAVLTETGNVTTYRLARAYAERLAREAANGDRRRKTDRNRPTPRGYMAMFKGLPQREMREYRTARRVPGARVAFRLGETLRDLGVEWCGGLVALWQAGYDAEVFERLAELARDDPALAAAFINLVVRTGDVAEHALPAVRTALVDWYCALGNRAAPLVKRKPPPVFRHALAIAQDGELSRLDRRSEAALILHAWAVRWRLEHAITVQLEMALLAVAEPALPALEPALTVQFEMTLLAVAEHAPPASEHAIMAQLEMTLQEVAEHAQPALKNALPALEHRLKYRLEKAFPVPTERIDPWPEDVLRKIRKRPRPSKKGP